METSRFRVRRFATPRNDGLLKRQRLQPSSRATQVANHPHRAPWLRLRRKYEIACPTYVTSRAMPLSGATKLAARDLALGEAGRLPALVPRPSTAAAIAMKLRSKRLPRWPGGVMALATNHSFQRTRL